MSFTFDCWRRHFFGRGELHASTERTEISVVVQNVVSMFRLWQQFCSKTAHLLPRSAAAVLLRPSCELLYVLRSADAEPTLQRLFSSAMFESQFWKQKRLTCLLHVQFLHMICVDLLPTGCWRITTDLLSVAVTDRPLLGSSWCLPDLHRKEMPTVTPCYDPLHYPRKPRVKHYEFRLRFFLAKFQF